MSKPTPEEIAREIMNQIQLCGSSDRQHQGIIDQIAAAIRAAEQRGEERATASADAAEEIILDQARIEIAAARLEGWEACLGAVRDYCNAVGIHSTYANIAAALTAPPAKPATPAEPGQSDVP